MQAVLINTTLATMLASLGSYVGYAYTRRRRLGYLGTGLFYLSFLLMTGFLADRWLATGRAPWSNMYESITTVLWCACGLYVVLEQMYRTRALGFLMAMLVVLGIMVASMFEATAGKLMPALQSYWLTIHVSILLAGYAAFTVSYAASVYYIFVRQRRKQRLPADATEVDFVMAIQDINVYQAVSTASMRFGFFALIVGIFLGGVWAQEAWGRFWGWDPKETWALITWIVYLFGLHVKYAPWIIRVKDLNHFHAWLAVVGFGFVVFTYFAVNLFVSGLHAYAVQGEMEWRKAATFLAANIAVMVVPLIPYLITYVRRRR